MRESARHFGRDRILHLVLGTVVYLLLGLLDMSKLTQSELKELLHYDPDTGVFTWKVQKSHKLPGSLAGSRFKDCRKYYWRIGINGKSHQAHRLAWLYVYGEFPKGVIDHIDHDSLNNRVSNLRDVDMSINLKNAKLYSNNHTGINGVTYCPERRNFKVTMSIDRKCKTVGRYNDFFEACCCRKSAEYLHGYHENHGRVT